MTVSNEPLSETTRRAMTVLTKELGVARTLRFLGQYRTGVGDYTADRGTFLGDASLDELLGEAARLDAEAAVSQHETGLAELQRGNIDAAEAAFRQALYTAEAAHGPDHPDVAATLTSLGALLRTRGDLHAAEAALRRAIAISEAALGGDYPDTAVPLTELGYLLRSRGELEGAESAFRRAISAGKAAHGPDHPDVATGLVNLGMVLQERGDVAEATAAYRQAVAAFERAFGPDHPATHAARARSEGLQP